MDIGRLGKQVAVGGADEAEVGELGHQLEDADVAAGAAEGADLIDSRDGAGAVAGEDAGERAEGGKGAGEGEVFQIIEKAEAVGFELGLDLVVVGAVEIGEFIDRGRDELVGAL